MSQPKYSEIKIFSTNNTSKINKTFNTRKQIIAINTPMAVLRAFIRIFKH